MSKTWFITGASRGLGVDIANAALKAGDRVVATGRQRGLRDVDAEAAAGAGDEPGLAHDDSFR